MAARHISPDDAEQLIRGRFLLLDMRTVPGNVAVSKQDACGRMQPNVRFVERNFGREARWVVGFQAGGRSVHAAELRIDSGCPTLVDVRGGFAGERNFLGGVRDPGRVARRLAIDRDNAPGHRYEDLKHPRPPEP